MPRRSLLERNIRKIIRGSRGSYILTLPKEFIKELKWQGKQKVVCELDKKQKKIVIKDWPSSAKASAGKEK